MKYKTFSKTLVTLAVCGYFGSANAGEMAELYSAPAATAIAGQYIVVYKKPEVIKLGDKKALADFTTSTTNELVNTLGLDVQRQYNTALSGILVTADKAKLASLLAHPSVDFVEQDSRVSVDPGYSINQANPTWGLDRIDQRALPLDKQFNPSQQGTGVTAFVIDTGINVSHNDFGGRASSGWDFIDGDNNANDCHGHGTHVAGTVGGTTWGVAKQANLVGVRVLSCSGSGSNSGVIAGVDWVANNANGPSVANMSLGGGKSTALNNAVAGAVNSGVFFAVAAGNDNGNACNKSPASEPSAYTVGSTSSNDNRSSFSNYGTCLDIYAPGSSIKSAWIGSNSATNTISGTSMASPHVAGTAALYLDADPSLSPAQLSAQLTANATANVVGDAKTGSPNLLVYTESEGAAPGLDETVSGGTNSNTTFTYTVPSGASKLTVSLAGNSGDADLYINHGVSALPFDSDCASATDGSNEECVINNPSAGTWHILVYGYAAFNNIRLTASHN
ncbi:S8 family serine peptidase [Thalassomonas haliotis]|uniref:S8 family peptidase n=1 Tax=Thalassomonas haliotis TaxID=485448 RepID=A0ABY7VCD4_9GAMM|nr:S8 family serine peptidase [Thalassomonas haliotis]WDE10557.1 S8 family peptidase [Thalassomonas haliotis]